MPITKGMFIFEVVIEKVNSLVESRILIIKTDFADIFSLELKDPKQMQIVIPEPPPLPPEPVGKKGKKRAKKPKPKKGKKGKKGKVEEPPPEPAIQAGQSVLFSSTAEFLIQNMNKFPLEISLWSKEEELMFIGTTVIPWDPLFLTYLDKIVKCQEPEPVTLKDEYNIFEEGKGKLMVKVGMQIKLSFLGEKVTTAFRTLSEDPAIKKCLYTGINSKTTSYMCTLKTSDEYFAENCNKVENSFVVDKTVAPKKIVYADFKNAPGANLTFFNDGDYCCMGSADKPPDSIYKSPETCPDIDFIVDYVRKIIVSCNDNMRMLTPRPAIKPRVKATDIDKLCYCKETSWPAGKFAERFRKEAQSDPCPLCTDAGKRPKGEKANRPATFDIANIRGPCGRPDCRIARDMRAYIENLVEEDNKEFDINQLIGPCGSRSCTLAEKIQEFIRHEGVFKEGTTQEGLSTQCACMLTMQQALTKKTSCESICSKDCSDSDSEITHCDGHGCPFNKPSKQSEKEAENTVKIYNVYYFTVEHDFETTPNPNSPSGTSPPKTNSGVHSGTASPNTNSGVASGTATPHTNSGVALGTATPHTNSGVPSGTAINTNPGSLSGTSTPKTLPGGSSGTSNKTSTKHKYCSSDCPSVKFSESTTLCSKSVCSTLPEKKHKDPDKCTDPVCTNKLDYPPSPADSKIVIDFSNIKNPCCVKTCDVADRVKEFIAKGVANKKKNTTDEDPCYCDCECTFKFSSNTTYCAVCGGYECLGEDMKNEPEYAKPHPCPVYHKLYDKKQIKTISPWPEEKKTPIEQAASVKSSKTNASKADGRRLTATRALERKIDSKDTGEEKGKKVKKEKKKVGKFTANVKKDETVTAAESKIEKKPEPKYPYPAVPRNMGWNWNADDIPGLKPRPKWRPGAANKLLVRRYRALREGLDIIAKKKRAMMNRKKKLEMKPTLIVKKKNGEYTVQMEVFKKYSKERFQYQYPYDEQKPPLIYTIGKTEAEKLKIQKQRDRRERRETRRKNRLLQSTFRDRCQEICLKAYNQAIGLLPLPNPNDPECPCYTNPPEEMVTPVIDSCSCSEDGTISTSDTDNDEWVIEFTPSLAKYDPKAKHVPNFAENDCQYNYLDYKVKLLDKSGNQVPRFFKGPDGKQECSDLGGFWGPDHVWMEINKDGYIGPDNKWVPMNFIGPDGMYYCAEEGSFTDHTGQLLKIGIDGYIDKDGKWAWYNKNKKDGTRSAKSTLTGSTAKNKPTAKQSEPPAKSKGKEATVNDTKPKDDKKSQLPAPTKVPDKDKVKSTVSYSSKQVKNPLIMSVSTDYDRNKLAKTPQRRLNIDPKKLAKYREIIKSLQMDEDFSELKMPTKTNRASNTPRKKIAEGDRKPSPFTNIMQFSASTRCTLTDSSSRITPLMKSAVRSCVPTTNYCYMQNQECYRSSDGLQY